MTQNANLSDVLLFKSDTISAISAPQICRHGDSTILPASHFTRTYVHSRHHDNECPSGLSRKAHWWIFDVPITVFPHLRHSIFSFLFVRLRLHRMGLRLWSKHLRLVLSTSRLDGRARAEPNIRLGSARLGSSNFGSAQARLGSYNFSSV